MAVEEQEASESQIAVHWREEYYYHPPAKFIAQANAGDPSILRRFKEERFPECFKEYADLLDWDAYWHTTLDTSNPPFWKWFVGGRLNASSNCVDRHLATSRNKAALIWVPEPEAEDTTAITYQELYTRVNEFAALLQGFCGVQAGDRVTFHLPMVPELPVSMLACARLGVIHSEVFGGFSGAACGDRIADSGSHILVTMDGYYRNGELVDHKAKADEAVATASKPGVEGDKVLIWRRHPGAYVAGTSKYYQDIHPDDTYWCMADIGWITGHSYIVYGPLALGTTSVIYEGVPTYPDPGRPWRIAERLGVTTFHTAPTPIRMLRKLGPDEPTKYDYHFKHMTTVGEPIEPEVWRWYHHVVGKDQAVIVDTWWQTENGGFLGSTLPALQPMKPGSCGPGVLGVYPVIYDEEAKVVEAGSDRAGNICIRNPWPGIFQTIWGQPDRFVDLYYKKYCKNPDSKDWRDWPYLAADAAAVPVMDDLRGRAVEMYVSLKPGYTPSDDIAAKVVHAIETEIGSIARPKNVWIVSDMPKTRSGKIMRRVIAAISNFADVGDITTLSNPEIVDDIRHHVQSEKVARGEVPRELSPQEEAEIKAFGQAE